MNILSIGNSFSQDAARYVHAIAASDGYNLTTVNLYIGGCSLYRHFQNISLDKKDYSLEFDGKSTGFNVSVKEALLTREWDVITLQQVSGSSSRFATYMPYLSVLADYCRTYAPKAKLYMHQTWAYENNSTRLIDEQKFATHRDMFTQVQNSYAQACKAIDADGIIPSGEVMCTLSDKGLKIHRDTFHASYGIGRYALGLTWYAYLTGKDIQNNTFSDFDEEISEENIKLIKQCVKEIVFKQL